MLASASPTQLEQLRFLSADMLRDLVRDYGTPLYVYSEELLLEQAHQALAFPAPYGLTVRYAMKANPLAAVLQALNNAGLSIDASSAFEVERAVKAGVPATRIMLTSQELPSNLRSLVNQGITYNATSLLQLDSYGHLFPGRSISIRVNSGLGSGHTPSVSVAGPTSSFGIWHEQLPDVASIAAKHHLKITGVHSHIGCGAESAIWQAAATKVMSLLEQLPDVTSLNLGGGFKVARMSYESSTDLQGLGNSVSKMLQEFAHRTGRKLKLEIEPGTFLVANAGTLIATAQDIINTGADGLTFLKLNTGMNDILRPALHASQHPIIVIADTEQVESYVVVGHNCESTDLLTPAPNDSEKPQPRELSKARVGDLVAIEGVGAYASAMRLIGYNSFPVPAEVMLGRNGAPRLIRRGESVDDLTRAEIY